MSDKLITDDGEVELWNVALTYHPNGSIKMEDQHDYANGRDISGNVGIRRQIFDDRGRILIYETGWTIKGNNRPELMAAAEAEARRQGRFRWHLDVQLPDYKIDEGQVTPRTITRFAGTEYVYDEGRGEVVEKHWRDFSDCESSRPERTETRLQPPVKPRTSEQYITGAYAEAIALMRTEHKLAQARNQKQGGAIAKQEKLRLSPIVQ